MNSINVLVSIPIKKIHYYIIKCNTLLIVKWLLVLSNNNYFLKKSLKIIQK